MLAWRRLRRDRAAMITLGVIVFIVACAIGAPVFAAITGHGNMQQFSTIGRTARRAAGRPERHVLVRHR